MTVVPNLQAPKFWIFSIRRRTGDSLTPANLPTAYRPRPRHHAACFMRLDRAVRVVPNGKSERVGTGGLLYSPPTCASHVGPLPGRLRASRRAYAAPRLFALGEGSEPSGRPAPLLSARTLWRARCREAGERRPAPALSRPRRELLQGSVRDRPRRKPPGRPLPLADQHLPRRHRRCHLHFRRDLRLGRQARDAAAASCPA